jgi:oligopeptide transport system substrate-binding protein
VFQPAIRLSLAVLILAFAAACGRLPDRADLVFINGAEPEPLDPPLITAQATGRVAYAVFEGLTHFNPEGIAQPGVAEKWELSPDGLVYTFHLRRDSRWSTGDPVTAHDFKYAWSRALMPATASEYASQMYYIKNAAPFNEGKITDPEPIGIKVLDDWTLQVTLENPTPYFLDLCAFSTYLPVHRPTVEKYTDWATKADHFVGNGPFLLKEWRLFDRVRLVKNPNYWNAPSIAMNSIDVLPSAKANTAFNFYATGIADLMMDKGLAPTPLMNELKKRPDFHASPFLGNNFIRYNVSRKPFNDVRVRLAFSLAIDKKLITEKITRAGEIPASSLTPPNTGNGYMPPPGLTENVEEARRLLAEAGYPGGKGFPIVYYLYKGDSDVDRDIAVELQGMFARVLGVNMQLQAQEWTVYLNSQSSLDYDLCRSSWVADYNDPNTFLNMFVTNDGNNRTGWSNPKYDGLIAAAGRELDKQKRFEIFQQAEKILISEDAPICPLYYYVGIQFYDGEKLGGIIPNLLDEHPLRYLHWKKPRR